MSVELLDRQPEPQLLEGGNGSKPPVVLETAVTAPEPPEQEQFNPDQAERIGAETEAQFQAITSQLGDVATNGAQIIANESHEVNSKN